MKLIDSVGDAAVGMTRSWKTFCEVKVCEDDLEMVWSLSQKFVVANVVQ